MERPTVLVIGHGAMARAVIAAAVSGIGADGYTVGAVLVRPARVAETAAALPGTPVIGTVADLPPGITLAAECAGHGAVAEHAAALLSRGIDIVIASIGALADAALHDRLTEAAARGGARLILPAGAVPGIDALAAARAGGLSSVTYTGRKPPQAWLGSPAEDAVDLASITAPVVFFAGTARQAALAYPKNANVAATVALAGLGLDATTVRLVADPGAGGNVHEIAAEGGFGSMALSITGNALPGAPRTSALAAYSVIRALTNAGARVVI